MPRIPPPLVVRTHDPARERRGQMLAGAIWIVSLIVAAAATAAIVSYGFESTTRSRGDAADKDTAALKARIDGLQVRMAAVEQKQGEYLAQVAVAELDQQKDRLATYQVQARFALATMYDRAANEEIPKKEPGAAVPKSMEEKSDTPEQGAAPPQPEAPKQ